MEILTKIIAETVEKLRDENIYPKEILDTIIQIEAQWILSQVHSQGLMIVCFKP